MMSDSLVNALIVALLLTRLSSLRRWWRLPRKEGVNWFLSTEVGVDFYQTAGARLLRRFHAWLLAPFAVDAGLIAILIASHRLGYILYEQIVMTVLAAIFCNLVIHNFSYKAKAYAAPSEKAPATAAQLVIEPRRLRDHTSWRLETALAVLTVAPFTLLVAYHKPVSLDLIWLLYLQAGLLLLKQVFVRWRMKLPLRRTDDYRRWRAAWLRYHLRCFDAARLLFALGLFYLTIREVFEGAFELGEHAGWSRAGRFAVWALIMTLFLVYCSKEGRRVLAVEREVKPMTLVKEFPPSPVAEGRFFAGGLLYFNPDNPVVIARSPHGLAINLASRSVYLWVAYLSGLVLFAAWQIIRQ
jgi:hypothetical protein